MIYSILKDAFQSKTLIGIRTDLEDWDEAIIGFIIELDDSFITINEIDEDGCLIGNTIITIADIISVDYDDRYQKRLKCIYENHSILKPNEQVTIWKEGTELIVHVDTLIDKKKIVTVYFDEENYVLGVVIKYDKDYVLIKNIGKEGDEDGFSCHPVVKLIGLKYEGVEEQKIELLHENRSSFY